MLTLFRFVDSESRHVQRTLQEMEDFSPIGSSILNKSGVIVEDRMNVSYIWIKIFMITFAADSNGASNAV